MEGADTNKTITFERTKFIGNYLDPPLDEMPMQGGAVYLAEVWVKLFLKAAPSIQTTLRSMDIVAPTKVVLLICH